MKKKVGVWIRVSSDMQVKDESPEIHLQRAKDYCDTHGLEIVEVYRLDGISGGAIWDLPVARKMRYDIQKKRIQALVFSALDRLGRDTLELLLFEKYFRDHGATLISIYENIDTSTMEGRFYFQGLANRAEYERARLSLRIKRGFQTRMQRGQIITHKAPFGYRKEAKNLVPDPIEGPIVQTLFKLFLETGSLSEVARQLNQKGFRQSNNRLFSAYNVRRILLNPIAKGTYHANRTASGGKQKPQEDWIEIPVSPLVSQEDWQRASAIIAKSNRPKSRTKHAYSGILRCHDGFPMYFRKRNDDNSKDCYFCRNCKNKILAKDLDSSIGEVVQSLVLNKIPAGIKIEISTETEHKSLLLQSLKELLKKAEHEKRKLIELFTAEALTLSEFKSLKNPLDERILTLEKECAALEFELSESQNNQTAENNLKQTLSEISWEQIPEGQKSRILKTLVQEITLSKQTIELNLLYVPSSLNEKFVQT